MKESETETPTTFAKALSSRNQTTKNVAANVIQQRPSGVFLFFCGYNKFILRICL